MPKTYLVKVELVCSVTTEMEYATAQQVYEDTQACLDRAIERAQEQGHEHTILGPETELYVNYYSRISVQEDRQKR